MRFNPNESLLEVENFQTQQKNREQTSVKWRNQIILKYINIYLYIGMIKTKTEKKKTKNSPT